MNIYDKDGNIIRPLNNEKIDLVNITKSYIESFNYGFNKEDMLNQDYICNMVDSMFPDISGFGNPDLISRPEVVLDVRLMWKMCKELYSDDYKYNDKLNEVKRVIKTYNVWYK